MKFDGKELFEIGVPKNKIKLFIGREFASREELLKELIPNESNDKKSTFTWIDWCFKNLKPWEIPDRNPDNFGKTSRSELKRIFDSGSVEINGDFPTSTTECKDEDFPISSFIWFPKSKKRRCTWIADENKIKQDIEFYKNNGRWY